jgi:hypothetical protein
MTHTTDNEIRVELKYCERCGGLWFRREKSRIVLCLPCTLEPADSVLRSCERPIALPPDFLASQVQSGAWYGPMTDVVQRMQGVAQSAGGAA